MTVESENIRCFKQKNGNIKVTAAVTSGGENLPFEVYINPKIKDEDGREYLVDDFGDKLLTEIDNLYHSCS